MSTGYEDDGPGEGVLALRRALRRAVWMALAGSGAVGAVLAVVAGVLAGWRGVWGVLIGIALAVAFLSITAVVGSLTAGRDPMLSGAVVLGSWLAKLVAAVAVVAGLHGFSFYSPPALLGGVAVGLIATLWAEYLSITTARIPYVDPRPSSVPKL